MSDGTKRIEAGFALDAKHVFLHDGGEAFPFALTPDFWPRLMGQQPPNEITERITQAGGWLMTGYEVTRDAGHWEMHPLGDEMLLLTQGRVDIVFETDDGEQRTELRPGQIALVPRGVWHRAEVHEAGYMVGITYGKGTEHKPRS